MDILQSLQNMLGQNSTVQANPGVTAGTGADGLNALLNPALLGGLAGALFSGKGAVGGILKGALLAGGGAYLWNKYKDRIKDANAGTPQYGQTASTPKEQAERLIRALVYAAKSDGTIDDKERVAIADQVRKLDLGADANALVQQAMNEPLDAGRIAAGIKNEEEALQIYTLTSAAIDIDQPAERAYLDSLATALKIPTDVKTEIDSKLKTAV